MLSGCCGVLSEHTRRQLYIIRTSGARLLSLINDVLDATILQQSKLVLKQERVSGRFSLQLRGRGDIPRTVHQRHLMGAALVSRFALSPHNAMPVTCLIPCLVQRFV